MGAPADPSSCRRRGAAHARRTVWSSGTPDAPVTLDVYADFQCRHCATFAPTVAPSLEAQEVAAGQARIVFHPIAFLGAGSVRAAGAAVSAADQEQFWAHHDALFANQDGMDAGAVGGRRRRQLAEALAR
ncbi:MAG TPA: thioredoxin domain-containing protein [Thermaerobacter sp.]